MAVVVVLCISLNSGGYQPTLISLAGPITSRECRTSLSRERASKQLSRSLSGRCRMFAHSKKCKRTLKVAFFRQFCHFKGDHARLRRGR